MGVQAELLAELLAIAAPPPPLTTRCMHAPHELELPHGVLSRTCHNGIPPAIKGNLSGISARGRSVRDSGGVSPGWRVSPVSAPADASRRVDDS
mmetsp:Transcript_26088/g.59262  ORF Transcript_26088/g.59262 Transcript_26088/m.59262 type:complete len:94 (+) Transcript_26088:676-957(+)